MYPPSISVFRRSAIYSAICTMLLPTAGWAVPLPLSTAPATSSYKVPAPNVIVSVDDSGSMGTAGMAALRNALQLTFAQSNVPDGSIRLAWQAMTNCFLIPSPACSSLNAMKVLNGTHRTNFMSWVGTLGPIGNTPSHRMLRNAGEYLKQPIDVNSAWASVPGVTKDPVLSCRRSYNLFMTDGGWNQTYTGDNTVGDADGTSRTLPDSTAYDTSSFETKVFRDNATGNIGGPFSTSLSDMAFHYWATDLQPGLSNDVKPLIKSPGDTTFSSGATNKTISQYWNPRNDPATWQHMTMYTVGFNAAASWTLAPLFGTDTWTGGDYDKLILGLSNWPNPITGNETTRITELWHMALNSRGKYVKAPNAAALVTAFQDIISEIIVDNSKPFTSLATSSTTLLLDSASYAAGYDAATWNGQVSAFNVTAGSGAVPGTGLWGTIPAAGTTPARAVSTADFMDAATFAPGTRVVLSANNSSGISWNWASLSTTQRGQMDRLNGVLDSRGQDRLDFIRGDRSKEGVAPPPPPPLPPGQPSPIFRTRTSRQGDIVNSKVWFTPGTPESPFLTDNYAGFRSGNTTRQKMIYVGGNDGMLHGFDAGTGHEKIAYVPEGLHSRLPLLTQQPYTHQYFVDGSPFTADVHVGSGWKTYLAGFLGLGGKGYFVLDVTNPGAFATTAASTTVVLDTTASSDPDIGNIMALPVLDQTNHKVALQLTKMNNNRWALVTGNGINSSNEKAVLLIQYLDGLRELVKIGTDNIGGNGNGLAAPRLIDLNGDRIPDVAYAGDLRGNLWKFDLSGASESDWKIAFSGGGTPTPFYVAKDAVGNRQPITTTPGWLFHPHGGLMISVGTGRSLTDGDRLSGSQQTLYGIYDPTSYTASGSSVVLDSANNAVTDGRASLVQQTISAAPTAQSLAGQPIWSVSENPVDYAGTPPKKGWFIELPDARERASNKDMQWLSGELFRIPTNAPAVGADPNQETCTPSTVVGENRETYVNLITGAAPKYSIFGYTSVNGVATNTLPAGVVVPSRIAADGVAAYLLGGNGPLVCISTPGRNCDPLLPAPPVLLRPTWRQAQ